MSDKPTVGGLILAGGRSVRFGEDKMAAKLAGKPLLQHVIDRLGAHCDSLAVNGPVGTHPALPHLSDDPTATSGPLAGILAGLNWASASKLDWLITAPCDTPFLPTDMVERLLTGAMEANRDMAICATADGQHPLCAIWRPTLAQKLSAELKAGHPPVHGFAAQCNAVRVTFGDATAFMNVNTKEDMTRAEKLLGLSGKNDD